MPHKAVFLDRDGTLVIDPGYVYKREHFQLHEGVIEGLKRLKGFKLFIITNQSGIGRGIFTEQQMHNFNSRMIEEFEKHNVKIEKIYFCPHTSEDKCDCRKPGPKFAKEAEKEFNLDLKHSFVIGDHPSDIEFAKNFHGKGICILTGHGKKHLAETRKHNPEYIAADFKQAVDYTLFDKEEKIVSRENLKKVIENLRKQKKSIVTLNGTFDILHKGHEKIITEAKQQGDILIVAVNSDSSARGNKGPERPFNGELQRARMITNFEAVDYVTIFPEKTPIELLEIIRPDVHVNGSEYGKDCIEAPTVKKHGGKIHIVTLLPGLSTTKLVKDESVKNHQS